MAFNPDLKIGQRVSAQDIESIFKCSYSGGMRRSYTTNSLVLITYFTESPYRDRWDGDVLLYTGMGLRGNQNLYTRQNKTLYQSRNNGVGVYLFESFESGIYVYCGQVKLVGAPYKEKQYDIDHCLRDVWIFPIQPIEGTDNIYKDDREYFSDTYRYSGYREDYRIRRIMPDMKYDREEIEEKQCEQGIEPLTEEAVGKKIRHNIYGIGTILSIQGSAIEVQFENGSIKFLDYVFGVSRHIFTLID